ncbi:chromosome segregation protein SMC [Romboutsia maritimum]|uniref:Chromosome partition protein Smc n=1 Tax=Romboutsia maritimum TaxID=2020948 RepID=A0A371IWE6_9FIRM|nr:chromosome segregation protein SMC [Romboutsia maritimum]RDY24806.1 chromosome segregation protein SMC [Romboutsia maritimum]
MYLKRLELKGFKSFPTKTDIIFKEGITAIVGPNGSGKSNISDAVRWVLGEQSIKSLRGDKLEDVIFAGTDSKKPMNYCEVALTIDNSDEKLELDFSEVTIKRRAYRNGESEFFLNNKSCRLKDIKEILLDTGIGKDGYSIIEQGKVDEILSPNPVNRRKVFDEACGISKYRYKKQEAERNLKNTKENLERIDDIYLEIENQLKPLFNQQSKAKKYIEVSEKLKTIEVNSYIKEIESLDAELKEINKHNELLDQQSKETEKLKESIENNFNQTNKDIENIDETISKAIDYINSIKSVMSQKDAQVDLIKERIKNFRNDIDRKRKEIKDIKEKMTKDKLNVKELEEKKYEKEKSINLLNNKVKDVELKNNDKKEKIENLNNEIEQLKDEIISLLNEKQGSTSKLSTLQANSENINSRTQNIDLDIEEIGKNINYKNNDLNNKKKQMNNTKENMQNLKIKENEFENKLKTLIENNSSVELKIQNNKYSMNDYNSKRNIYIDMENHYEGFNRGVKEVLKNKSLQGIYGALGQVVTVPEEFEKAVEAALGAYMQNIITKDEHSAKFAINYLKKNNLGRVTFLPLNIIKSNKIDTRNIRSSTKFIGVASDLISYDEKYKNIFESILGRTIIIDNIDDGIKFAKETGHKFKVVTLDGEILNPGGSLTGGSLRTNGNILSRKRLIQEYTEKIEFIKNENTSLIEYKDELNENIFKVKKEINEAQNSIKELDKSIIMQTSIISRVEEEVNTLNNSKEKLENEKHGLDSNLEYTIKKTNIVKEEVKEIENKYNNNKNKIEVLSVQLKEYSGLYEDDRDKFDKLNLELVKNNQIYDSLIKDIQRINKENLELDEKANSLEESLKSEEIETTQLEEDIIIEQTEKESLNKQLLDSNRNLEIKKASKESLKSRLEDFNKELKAADRQYMDLKESLFKVQGRLERVKATKETYINKLFEKYEMTLVEAIEVKDDSIEIDKKVLEGLKKEIRNLGNVNLDSIKEYEEVKERYDFYSEQKQDLEESIEAIEKLISELEENMKSEFEVKFNEINENFKYVYKRLFGGGYGELTILDKDNILESDIEITAQPLGKKMKNLNLLSGGEKALTAISILFSILLSKPTPFCILDEIEAPLDDANIYRFGEFLKELAKDTQFISVTHRRGTMEAADYIYGITMQEKAISKVISLQLKDAEELTDII